jgi:hypothetical protein
MGEEGGTQGGKKAQPGEPSRWGLGDHTNSDDAGKDNIGWVHRGQGTVIRRVRLTIELVESKLQGEEESLQ